MKSLLEMKHQITGELPLATLSSAVYRKFDALSIHFVCDVVGYFQFKNGVFQCIGLKQPAGGCQNPGPPY